MSDATDALIPLVEPGTRSEIAELEDKIRSTRGGDVPLLYQALLHSPPIAAGWENLLTAVRQQTVCSPTLRELIILRVAVLNKATYEFEQHAPIALTVGLTEQQLDAVHSAAYDPGLFSAQERLTLELTDALTRDLDVPTLMMEQLRETFDSRSLVELVTTVSAYNMVSRFVNAFGIGH